MGGAALAALGGQAGLELEVAQLPGMQSWLRPGVAFALAPAEMVETLTDTGKRMTADQALGVVRAIYRWGIGKDKL
jgi:hypothetical protein